MNRVSVIITTYNYAKYLSQVIQSVLDQTYNDYELIVVNDGSTDNTSEVVKPFLNRIIYIDQKNSGVVTARNNGAKKALGEYLLFLDADDYLPNNFIESAIRVIQTSPKADFVYGDREMVGGRNFRQCATPWSPQLLKVVNYVGLTSLVSKQSFDQVGGFSLDLNREKSYEDWDFWLKLLGVGKVGRYNPGLFYYYRYSDSGNRNQAGTWLKIKLKWAVIRRHGNLYAQPAFWLNLPLLLSKAALSKISIMKSS